MDIDGWRMRKFSRHKYKNMSVIITIIASVGPIILGIVIATLTFPLEVKILAWIFCALISIYVVFNAILKWKKGRKEEEKSDFYYSKMEKMELRESGLPTAYIDGLGEHPELQHFLNNAKKYEKEDKYVEAIEEYEKCLTHPRAQLSHKTAANILTGVCFYNLSQLNESCSFHKEALKLVKAYKDKTEKQEVKAICLGNIGLVYSDLGKPEEALKQYNQALEIFKQIQANREIEMVKKNIEITEREIS